jgi:hypothetical protein
MKIKSKTVLELLELANHYPSPHNGQPIRVRQIDDNQLELFFDKQRGLQAADISFIFSFVSMGVFAEHLKFCAQALGHEIEIILSLPNESDLRGAGLILFARGRVKWSVRQPNQDKISVIEKRQTSRKKYYQGISQSLATSLIDFASSNDMKLVQLSSIQAQKTIWLNQRAVFDDMFDEPVRQELSHWLRYNQQQKLDKSDGLSYDCMELNGKLLKYIVDRPGIIRVPLISRAIKEYYLRTMKDNSSVFYMMAPFMKNRDAYNVGTAAMHIWLLLSKSNSYIHPLGTIMSNHNAHTDFLQLVGEKNESRAESYLVFIFRAGKSKPPAKSVRIPTENHLILE